MQLYTVYAISITTIFYPPKPEGCDSWTLNTTTATWEPPVPHPEDALSYTWDEDNQQWVGD